MLTCQYPTGDRPPFTWCNRFATHGSYCAKHDKLCHRPSEPGTHRHVEARAKAIRISRAAHKADLLKRQVETGAWA